MSCIQLFGQGIAWSLEWAPAAMPVRRAPRNKKTAETEVSTVFVIGSPGRIRTAGQAINSRLLYR
jgi:hypothetical protein